MDIQQIQSDRKNGVTICRVTYDKLVEASANMQQALANLSASTKEANAAEYAAAILAKVDEL